MTGPQRGDLVHGPPQPAVSLREATLNLKKSSLIQSVEGRAGGLGFAWCIWRRTEVSIGTSAGRLRVLDLRFRCG